MTAVWPRSLSFVVVEDHNMLSVVGAIEPFRVANHLLGEEWFRWSLVSTDGRQCVASNGIRVEPDGDLASAMTADLTLVCTSWFPERHGSPRLIAWLRDRHAAGARLGGIDTGAFVLAKAGLLNGRRATCNYDVLDAFSHRFPEVDACDVMFVVDERHPTCSAGTAPIDFGVALVAQARGDDLARRVAAHLFHERVGGGVRSQIGSVESRQGVEDERLVAALQLLSSHIDSPLSVIALAEAVGTSSRQLQRLFVHAFGLTPAAYAMQMRLERARQYLLHTELRVVDVAVACGFESSEHFSRRYARSFGRSPLQDRKQHRPRVQQTTITQRVLD